MPRYFLMAQPARIVLDLPDTQVGDVKMQESYGGAVRQVRVSQFQPGMTRIVMELSPDVTLAPAQAKLEKVKGQPGGDRWVLRPLIAMTTLNTSALNTSALNTSSSSSAAKVQIAPQPASKQPASQQPASQQPASRKQTPALPPPPESTPFNAAETLPRVMPTKIAPVPSVTVPGARGVPPAAIGSDFTAVTREPDPIPAQPQPVKSSAPLVAQSLPETATTPLPPNSPPSELTVDTRNAIKISVPSPIAPPTAKPSEMVVNAPVVAPKVPYQSVPRTNSNLPAATVAPLLTQPQSFPVQTAIAPPQLKGTFPNPIPTQSAVTPKIAPQSIAPQNGTSQTMSTEVPSSIKFLANVPPQVSVPPLTPLGTTPMPPPAAVPMVQQPASMPVPPLNSGNGTPLMVPPPASVTPMPNSSVMQPPNSSVMQPPNSSVMQPPNSSVMQPPNSSVMQPPNSSVMQPPNSSVMQPPNSSVMQMPNSSVMQMPNSSVMQTPGTNGMQPSSSFPTPGAQGMPSDQSGAATVPPLQTFPSTQSAPSGASFPAASVTPPKPVTTPGMVEFGQPLPTGGARALNTIPQGISGGSVTTPGGSVTTPGGSVTTTFQQPMFQSSVPGVILPIGALLNLLYPGNGELRLAAGMPRQEVLVLQTEVRDAMGNVVLPQGSYVMGQFETGQSGSKFTAQSISAGSRTLPFAAESEVINGNNRELSPSSMALYSGAGALAGGLISQFSGWGILLGGAAGAATNYLTAPKPAAIQPGQMIQVRVTQELR